MNTKLYKVTFSIDCDILVSEHTPTAALDAICKEDLIEELRNVVDVDYNHCVTEEITKESQIPGEWRGSDPLGIDVGMSVNDMAKEIEEKNQREVDRQYADSLQIQLGV